MKPVVGFIVILSGAGVERSGTPAQSKDPYPKRQCRE